MISSAASQIEAKGGENLYTTVTLNGQTKQVPDYATVQGILIGVVAASILVVTILGPEAHGAHFEKHRTAFEKGGGRDDALVEEGEEGEEESPSGEGSFEEKRSSAGMQEVA